MGKFIVKKVQSGYNFYLKAANGETIGTSEVYNSKEACMNGVESVVHHAPKAAVEDQTATGYLKEKCPKFEIYLDKAAKYRFRLIASNGQEILASQAYTAKPSCRNGIHSVQENAPGAELEVIE